MGSGGAGFWSARCKEHEAAKVADRIKGLSKLFLTQVARYIHIHTYIYIYNYIYIVI